MTNRPAYFVRHYRLDGLSAVLPALMVLVFFWDVLFSGKIPYLRDAFCDYLPYLTFSRQAISGGAIPLWNHYSQCGQPFIALPETAFFYPLNALFYLLPMTFAMKLSLALHQFIAAITCYALMRHWKLQRIPALLSATAFAFSTRLIASMEFLDHFNTLVWLPLPLLLLSRLTERWMQSPAEGGATGRLRSTTLTVIFMAVVLAVQFLAGYTQTFMFSLMFLVAYALLRPLAAGNFRAIIVSCAALAAAGALAIALVLPQLLLTLELIGHSGRAGNPGPQMEWASLHPRLFFSWLLPFFAGWPGYCGTWWGASNDPQKDLTMFEFWAGTAYIGIAPLTLVFAALSSVWPGRRHKPASGDKFLVLFFGFFALAGLLLAMGKYTPAYSFFCKIVPVFNKFRWPSKFLEIVVFATSVLAGLGLQAILNSSRQPTASRFNRYTIIYLMWLIAALIMATGYFYARRSPAFFSRLTGGAFIPDAANFKALLSDYSLALVFLIVSAALLAVLTINRHPRITAAGSIALIVITYINLFVVGRQIHFITADDIYEEFPQKALEKVSSDEPFRIMTSYAMYAQQLQYGVRDERVCRFAKDVALGETWLPYHIFKTSGGGTLKLLRYELFADPLYFSNPESKKVWQRLVDLMNIRYVISGPAMSDIVCGREPPAYDVIKNDDCLPRAFIVEDWKVIADDKTAVKELLSASFDPRRSAVIDRLPHGQLDNGKADNAAKDEADSTKAAYGVDSVIYDWNRVELKVHAAHNSLLVLSDVWYPGWKALVDGRPKQIVRANHVFRGIFLEPGRHSVIFTYTPWQFKVGMVFCIIAMAGICITLFLLRKRPQVNSGC
jgi:hypothetical protein